VETSLNQEGGINLTWEELKTNMKHAFGQVDAKKIAFEKFQKIQQGNQTAATYWAEFQRIKADLPYADNICVTNLARQAPWRWRRCHSHPCRPVARPRFRCRSRGHPSRLGTSTDLRHIAPVAISPTAGRSRPLSFVSVMLLARPSPVIVTYVVSC